MNFGLSGDSVLARLQRQVGCLPTGWKSCTLTGERPEDKHWLNQTVGFSMLLFRHGNFVVVFLFFLSSGGLVKIKLKLTTLPRSKEDSI